MAGLVVEDGSIVSGANSYVSSTQARAYLDLRGILTELTDGVLVRGADYINSFRSRFKGNKLTAISSNMQFPRSNVVIDGYDLPPDQIPQAIVDAQIQTALEMVANRDPLATIIERPVRKQKLGPLEVEYDTSSAQKLPTYSYKHITLLLAPLLVNNFGRVSR